MQKVGVEAIVAGLGSFLGDMKKVDKSIKDLIPGSNLLSRAFEGVGSVVQWLTGSVFRVLEYTLGNLLASAIQSVVGWLRDLVTGAMDSADEFAKLQLRLERLNFNSLTESGEEYTDIMAEAVRLTKEQIAWATRLAASTPFDAKDVTNVYTLARGYEFTADEAKSLTEAVIDFTSGMGLSATEMERVIINFGQMRQQGKLNGQDLKDLARGAFVPVNRVLEITAQKLGMTTEEFNKLRSRGALSADAVNVFRESFEELVGVRFEGAAEKMGSVFSVAKENIEGLIRDLIGMNVVMPVLNILGERMQAITEAIASSDERWNSLTASMSRIGEAVAGIITDLMGIAPSAEGIADALLTGLDKIADWLEEHRDDIVAWAQKSAKWVGEELLPKITELWGILFGSEGEPGAIQKFGDWAQNTLFPFLQQQILPVLQDISDLIFGAEEDSDLATSINEINGTPLQNVLYIIMSLKPLLEPLKELFGAIGDVIITAFGGEEPESFAEFVTNTLVPAIQDLTKFIDENKEGLANLIKVLLLMSILGTVAAWVVSLTIKILAFLAAVGGAVIITPIILAVVAVFNILKNNITTVVNIILLLIEHLKNRFTDWKNNWTQTINDVVTAFKNKDWAGIGKAIIDGLIRGVQSDVSRLMSLVSGIATQVINNFRANLRIKSPSAIFEDIGEKTIQGFAEGITNAIGLAKRAMSQVTGATLSIGAMAPARLAGAMAPGTVSNNTTNNLTLNMQSSAPTENIIADFEMMRSMVS